MSLYVRQLQERTAAAHAEQQARRAEQQRTDAQAARERLTPLDDRLARLLATIPMEVQREGFSLASLQAALRGRWRGTCHPGELGIALRLKGFQRARRWSSSEDGFRAIWRKQG